MQYSNLKATKFQLILVVVGCQKGVKRFKYMSQHFENAQTMLTSIIKSSQLRKFHAMLGFRDIGQTCQFLCIMQEVQFSKCSDLNENNLNMDPT